MVGETFLDSFGLFVPFPSLVEDDIDDLVVFTYVLCWSWHKFVNGFAE